MLHQKPLWRRATLSRQRGQLMLIGIELTQKYALHGQPLQHLAQLW
jgi:hypothetical protein